MDNSNNDRNMEAWKKFLDLLEERYPACMNSNKDEDIFLRNAIVEILAGACS